LRPDNTVMNTRFVVELESGDVLPLERARGVRLVCLEGSLWLTEEHAPTDVVLAAGESHAVEDAGRTLVQALGRSRLAVEAAGRTAQVAFGAIAQVRLAA
jgi:hypothetical protein